MLREKCEELRGMVLELQDIVGRQSFVHSVHSTPPPSHGGAPVARTPSGGVVGPTVIVEEDEEAEEDGASFGELVRQCRALVDQLHAKIHEDILSVEHVSHVGNKFSSKSTIGAMLVGSTIDNTVFGGPAYNAGQLEKGDQIVSVDGVVVTNENLHDLLVGQDVPGSVVKLHMRKVLGEEVDVTLKRMATSVIADKVMLFELFTAIKDRAMKSQDTQAYQTCDACIALWTKMVVSESEHEEHIVRNVEDLQGQCAPRIETLHTLLEKLEEARGKSSPPKRTSSAPDAAYVAQVQEQLRWMGLELDRMSHEHHAALDSSQLELHDARARLAETQARLGANAAKFDEVAKSKAALADSLGRREEELAAARARIAALEQVQEQAHSLAGLARELADAKQRAFEGLEKARAGLAAARRELAASEASRAATEATLAKQQVVHSEEMAGASDRIRDLEEQVAREGVHLGEVQSGDAKLILDLTARVSADKALLEASEAGRAEAEVGLSRQQDETTSLQDAIQRLKGELAEAAATLERKVDHFATKVDEGAKSEAELVKSGALLAARVRELEEEVGALQTRLEAEKGARAQDASTAAEGAGEERGRLLAEGAALQDEVKRLEEDLATLADHDTRLAAELKQALHEKSDGEEALGVKIQDLESEVEALKKSGGGLREEEAQLKKQILTLDDRLRSSMVECDHTGAELGFTTSERDALLAEREVAGRRAREADAANAAEREKLQQQIRDAAGERDAVAERLRESERLRQVACKVEEQTCAQDKADLRGKLRETERWHTESKDNLRQALKDVEMIDIDRANGADDFRSNIATLKHQISELEERLGDEQHVVYELREKLRSGLDGEVLTPRVVSSKPAEVPATTEVPGHFGAGPIRDSEVEEETSWI